MAYRMLIHANRCPTFKNVSRYNGPMGSEVTTIVSFKEHGEGNRPDIPFRRRRHLNSNDDKVLDIISGRHRGYDTLC